MSCFAPSVLSIRTFNPDLDSRWLHDLWQRTIHERWDVRFEVMLSTLTGVTFLLVAEYGGVRSGFCAVDMHTPGTGGLLLLLVEPALQRLGVGSALVRATEDYVRTERAGRLTLGAGDGGYFWPGLPAEQNEAWRFFASIGFREADPSKDLVQELDAFGTPAWVSSRLTASGTILRLAEASQAARLLAFEQTHFPAWAPYFEGEIRQGSYGNILLALDREKIVGTVLVRSETSLKWKTVQGMRIGTLNTLGVAAEKQGQGIGLALTAGAMETLRTRGCSQCHIQWTGLKDWYGKLGAKIWAEYRMAYKLL